ELSGALGVERERERAQRVVRRADEDQQPAADGVSDRAAGEDAREIEEPAEFRQEERDEERRAAQCEPRVPSGPRAACRHSRREETDQRRGEEEQGRERIEGEEEVRVEREERGAPDAL